MPFFFFSTEISPCSSWQPQGGTISQQSTIQVSPIPLSTGSGNLSYKGTRLSTILLVRNNGHVLFIERDIWKLGDGGVPVKSEPPSERKYNFQLDLEGNRSSWLSIVYSKLRYLGKAQENWYVGTFSA